MKRVFLFIIISGLFFGCSVTKGIKNETVKKAINLQDEVIKNPLFKKIILELEATNDIDWSEGRTNFIKEDIAEYKSYTHWLIEKYESKGVYDENSVFL